MNDFHDKNGFGLLNPIALSVTLDNGKRPSFQAGGWSDGPSGTDALGDYRTRTLAFRGEEESDSITLELKCYASTVLAYVSVQLKQDVFGVTHALAPEAGLRFSVSDPVGAEGILAHYNHYKWWTRPYIAEGTSALPAQTQTLLWRAGGRYTQLFPACSDVCKTTLQGNGDGFDIVVSPLVRGFRSGRQLLYVLSESDASYIAAEQAAAAMLHAMDKPVRTRESKSYPEAFDYLGWCTWDAFYHEVSEHGIEAKAAELQEKDVPVRWVMIDDGWSPVREDKTLSSLGANAEKFPNGLLATVRSLKNHYGVKWVGVWHAFTGYWHGIEPGSELASDMRDVLFADHAGRLIPHPDPAKGLSFWKTWHESLARQGIDMIKVDSQSSLVQFVQGQLPLGRAAAGLHQSLEASAALFFDGRLINCMGMAQENVWNRGNTAISRNSDDFYPSKPDWFREHALQNAYNSVYHGTLYWGDWDMWWTSHDDSVSHAVLRAVSGGPVYISDPVGTTDASKLRPLIYSNGRVLRADRPGLPTEDCLFTNPVEQPVPLKVWNRSGDCGLLAAFHLHSEAETVSGKLRIGDVPGLAEERYAVLDHFNRQAFNLDQTASHAFSVERGQPALFAVVPYRDGIACFGLVDKYVSPAAIESCWSANGRTVLALREGGLLGFACDTEPAAVLINGEHAKVQRESGFYTVDCADSKGSSVLVEIMLA
ncbi:Sip1-related alpha-galactosidase [Paenibacillus rhizovicinus]|nr:Sip1-related alpha-galactosidase [Paenibacillus rhizovicinus]